MHAVRRTPRLLVAPTGSEFLHAAALLRSTDKFGDQPPSDYTIQWRDRKEIACSDEGTVVTKNAENDVHGIPRCETENCQIQQHRHRNHCLRSNTAPGNTGIVITRIRPSKDRETEKWVETNRIHRIAKFLGDEHVPAFVKQKNSKERKPCGEGLCGSLEGAEEDHYGEQNQRPIRVDRNTLDFQDFEIRSEGHGGRKSR